MMKQMKAIFIVLVIYLGFSSAWRNNDKVLLDEVQVLTLKEGQMTTGRRSSPVSQLSCVGGSASGYRELYPKIVQCKNMGKDSYGEVQWKCESQLTNAKLGKITVSCEGYDYPDDPYILKGSCGLEYELDLINPPSNNNNYYYSNTHNHQSQKSSSGTSFFSILVILFLVYIIYQFFARVFAPNNNADQAGGHAGSHNGGAGPSSGLYPDPYDTTSSSSSYSSSSYAAPPRTTGFWTNFGLGALTGYLFGSRPYYNNYNNYYTRPSWGWGSNTNYYNNSAPGYSRGYSAPSAPSSSSGSSSPRTSTSYGGTKRR